MGAINSPNMRIKGHIWQVLQIYKPK